MEPLSIIHSLKSKNFIRLQWNGILKTCSFIISCPLRNVCNQLLYTGVFCDCSKLCVVTLLYKHETAYYRPVALLMLLLSMVLKRIIHKGLNILTYWSQENFTSGKGYLLKILPLSYYSIFKSVNQNKHVEGTGYSVA
jgi:hypothetical protein